MAQKPEDQQGSKGLPHRPQVPLRNDSFLPPHLRSSVTAVPVTPDITQETYESDNSNNSSGGQGPSRGDYFSRRVLDHAIAASPAPDSTNREGQSFHNKVTVGAQEGKKWMNRLTEATMAGRRESMSEFREISPDLALSGNIISATFNIPHSLKYRKGSDWVCLVSLFLFFFFFLSSSSNGGVVDVQRRQVACIHRVATVCQVSEWWG